MHSGNYQQAAPSNAGAQAQQQRPPQVQHSFQLAYSPSYGDRRHEFHAGKTAPLLTFGPLPPNIPAQQQPSQQVPVPQNYYTHPQQQLQMNQRSNAPGTNFTYYDQTTRIPTPSYISYCDENPPPSSIERINIIEEGPNTSQPSEQPHPSLVPRKKKEKKLSKRPANQDEQPRKKPEKLLAFRV